MAVLSRVRTIFGGVAGTPWYSNIYFVSEVGQAAAKQAEVDAFWTTLAGIVDASVTAVIQGEVAQIDDATGEIVGVDTETPLDVNFTGAGDMLPPANQMLLNALTGQFIGGRQVRGKIYLPGIIEAAANPDGTPAAAFTAALIGAGEDLIADSAASGAWVVYSPTHGTNFAVNGVSSPSKFAVMRSRRD